MWIAETFDRRWLAGLEIVAAAHVAVAAALVCRRLELPYPGIWWLVFALLTIGTLQYGGKSESEAARFLRRCLTAQ